MAIKHPSSASYKMTERAVAFHLNKHLSNDSRNESEQSAFGPKSDHRHQNSLASGTNDFFRLTDQDKSILH